MPCEYELRLYNLYFSDSTLCCTDLLIFVLFTEFEFVTYAQARSVVELAMRELGDPNDTLEQRLERRWLENPELSSVPTDEEDDLLEVNGDF